MSDGVRFEDYLRVKKIDSDTFRRMEPDLWRAWKAEFEQVHPNSFTLQKLNLINAVRRKYLLADLPDNAAKPIEPARPQAVQAIRPGSARPVIKPKPRPDPDSVD